MGSVMVLYHWLESLLTCVWKIPYYLVEFSIAKQSVFLELSCIHAKDDFGSFTPEFLDDSLCLGVFLEALFFSIIGSCNHVRWR